MSDDPTAIRATGRCLCSAISFTVRGPLRTAVVACHCTNCRRFTGGVWTGTTALKEHVVIERGATLIWYRSTTEVQRGFCGNCGSSLFWVHDEGPLIGIAAGSLNEPTGLKLEVHSWVSEAADFWSFDPDVRHTPGPSGLEGP